MASLIERPADRIECDAPEDFAALEQSFFDYSHHLWAHASDVLMCTWFARTMVAMARRVQSAVGGGRAWSYIVRACETCRVSETMRDARRDERGSERDAGLHLARVKLAD